MKMVDVAIKFLGRLSIRAGVIAAVAVASVVALAVGLVGLVQLGSVSSRSHALFEHQYEPAQDIAAVRENVWKARFYALKVTTAVDAKGRSDFQKQFDDTNQVLAASFASYDKRDLPTAQKQAMAAFATDWNQYLEMRHKADALHAAGKLAEWQEFGIKVMGGQVNKILKSLEELSSQGSRAAQTNLAEGDRAASRGRALVIAVLVVGLLGSITLALLLVTSIVRPLDTVRRSLQAMSRGDLSGRLELDASNEIGQMGTDLSHAIARMREALTAVDRSSAAIDSQAGQLQQASSSLVGASEDASHRVGEMTDAVTTVTTRMAAVASGSNELCSAVNEISARTQDAARISADAVSAAGGAEQLMVRLGASSAEIGNVIQLITSIAEQTNLLALNATIEAARAGDAGKGFAVVADEVKQLAQETAHATKDISGKVEAIQSDTRTAVDSISRVSEVIGQINDYQASIASAVEEQNVTTSGMASDVSQAAGSGQIISEGVDAVASAATRTHLAADEVRQSAADLSALSHELRQLVSGFRL